MKPAELPVARAKAFASLLESAQAVDGIPVLAILHTNRDGKRFYTLSIMEGITDPQAVSILRTMADELDSPTRGKK